MLAMLGLGLASGLHCLGMCGGIVTAFSIRGRSPNGARLLAFNAGRITTYAAGGAAAGAVGALGWYAAGGAQALLYAAANVMLIAVGLHVAGVRTPLLWAERLGVPLWRRVQPVAAQGARPPAAPAARAARPGARPTAAGCARRRRAGPRR